MEAAEAAAATAAESAAPAWAAESAVAPEAAAAVVTTGAAEEHAEGWVAVETRVEGLAAEGEAAHSVRSSAELAEERVRLGAVELQRK